MAGGHAKYRHLSRNSAHRQSLLRNLVTSLFRHEAITTTFAKAKEAQRLAEKLITLGKKNTSASRRRATQIFFNPVEMVPRLFEIAPRYANRPGGYTRVLRTGPRDKDAGEGAVLSLVDGSRDVRQYLTAQTVARDNALEIQHTQITEYNIKKCTNPEVCGPDAKAKFEELVAWYTKMEEGGADAPGREIEVRGKQNEEIYYPRNGAMERKYGGRGEESRGLGSIGVGARRIATG